jgi:hypothetical protein
MEAKEHAYKIVVDKPERKRPLGRLRHRWKNNIKVDLKYGVKVWTGSIWLRIRTSGGLNTEMNLKVL